MMNWISSFYEATPVLCVLSLILAYIFVGFLNTIVWIRTCEQCKREDAIAAIVFWPFISISMIFEFLGDLALWFGGEDN